jgi:hypothetical protein
LYAALFEGLAADHAAGGLTAELLDGVTTTPLHDALPLRFAGAAHRLALAGLAPALADMYPSCGGSWNGSDPTALFLDVVRSRRDMVVAGLRRNVQTNEVGRAVVLQASMCWISEHFGLPLRTLEVGASGGLLSNWADYAYDTGITSGGDPASRLRFGPEWYRSPPPPIAHEVAVVDRAASDVAPIDAATDDGRLTMLSFVWPDQSDRLERLRAAIDVAHRQRIDVERADAGRWLTERLVQPLPTGVVTVVFHSIVWQYLPPDTRRELRSAIERAAIGASVSRPLVWLRMEPATREHADVRATVWPGGREHHLADVGYHGADVHWLA